ncbi:porin [Paraburkholderia fynbosensis]|uniref:Outer membrane porin protein n=1 Tax=Paraburkholderia fynbosensis TaxID=1200993 RepID=A0A6J5H4V2_9BURK|nr:porin [Paraburkholderia fynbosensis]CAB3810523.1 Outer membrane porin protein [Paraburkholderia fynbosensis]
MFIKRKHLAAAAVASAVVSVAHAQSSVTLYGVLDESVQFTNSGKSPNGKAGPVWGLGNSANNTTVWGIKGSEDLGGGMHAIFDLESGFNLGNGASTNSGDMFSRQSWVGVKDDRWGTLTLGKQYSPVTNYLCPVSAYCTFGGNTSAHVYDNDTVGGSYTVSNSVTYESPVIAGWHFGSMYAFSNAAGQFQNNRLVSAGTAYDYGPFHFAAAYMDADNLVSANNSLGAVNAGMGYTIAAGDQTIWGGGARADIGAGTVGLLYTHSTYLALASGNSLDVRAGDDLRFDNYSVYGKYPLTHALSVGAGYTFTTEHLSGATSATLHNQQVTMEVDYGLSRRTLLYTEAAYQHVSGGNGLSLSYAEITDTGIQSGTNSQTQVSVGIRHNF